MEERRRFMRFNVLLEAVCRTNGALKKFTVNNFSRGGLGILSRESFSAGENVEIELMLPDDDIPVLAEGAIAWTARPAPSDSKHKGGMKLNRISSSDRNRLLEYIYQKWLMPTNGKNTIKNAEEK